MQKFNCVWHQIWNTFATMKKHITSLLFALVALTPSIFCQDANQEAPSVQVKDIDGAPINFNSTVEKGKITVVSLWATWCGPCIKELQAIDELYADWQTKYNVKLVAVSIDDARNSRKVKPKVLAENWQYQIILDENMDLARAMNVNNPPMTFVFDKNGKLVYSHQGYTPGAESELEAHIAELAK